MTGRIEVLGLDPLRRRVRDWPYKIDAEMKRQIEHEIAPMVGHMRERGSRIGGAASITSATVTVATIDRGMVVKAGGSGLAKTLMPGSEYGGRKRPKRPYVNRSRSGKAYVMKRRATMQFKPHLGNRGYWFWPTARTDLKGINRRVSAILSKVANG